MNPLNFRPITHLIKSATFLSRTFLLITRACCLSACCGPPDITGPPLTCVSAAPHDISPPLESQLVLELEVWKLLAEGFSIFPCGRLWRFAAPMDEQLTNASRQASMLNPAGF